MMMRTKSTTQILDSQVEMSMSMNLGVKSINVKPKGNVEPSLKKKKPKLKLPQQSPKKKTSKNAFLGSTTELLQLLARNITEPSQRTQALRAIQRVPSKVQGTKREAKPIEPTRRRTRRKSDTQELANILASYMIAQSENFSKKQSEQGHRRNSPSPARTNKRLKQNAESDFVVQQSVAKPNKNENVRLPLVVPKETLVHKTQSKIKSHTTDHSQSATDVATVKPKEPRQPRKAKTQKVPKAEADTVQEVEIPVKKARRPNTPVASKEPAPPKITKIPVPKERPSSGASNKDVPQKKISKVASKDRTPSPPNNKAQKAIPKIPVPKEEKQPQTPKKARRIPEAVADTTVIQKKPSAIKKKESKLVIHAEAKKQLTVQSDKKKQLKKSTYSLQISTRTSSDSTLRSLTLTRSDYSISSEPGTADLNLRKLNEIVTNFKEEITQVVQHTSNNTSQNNSHSSKRSSSSKKRKARSQNTFKSALTKKKSLIPVLKKIRHKAIEPAKQDGTQKRPATVDGSKQRKPDHQNMENYNFYGDMVLARAQTNPPTKAKPIEEGVRRRKLEVKKEEKEVSKLKPKKMEESANKKVPRKGKSVRNLRSPSQQRLIDILPSPSYADTLAEYKTIADKKLRFKSKSAANIEKRLLELKSSRSQGMIPKLKAHKKDIEKKEQNKSKNTNTKTREDKLDTKQVNEISESQTIKFGDQMDVLKTLHGDIQAIAQSSDSLTTGILAASKYDVTIESFVKFTQEQISQFQKPFGHLDVQKSDASTTTLDRFKLIKPRSHQASQTDFKLVMVDSSSKTDLSPRALMNDEYVEQGMDLAKRSLTEFFSLVKTKADLVPKLNDNSQLIGDTCALSFNVEEDVTKSDSNRNAATNSDKILLKKLIKVEHYLNMVMYYYRLALETKHSVDNMVRHKMPAIQKVPQMRALESRGLYKVRKTANLCKQLSRTTSQTMEYNIPKSFNIFNASVSFNKGVYDISQGGAVLGDCIDAMRKISFDRPKEEEKTPDTPKKSHNQFKHSKRRSKHRSHAILKKKVANTTSQKSLTKMSPLEKILSLITKNYISEVYTDKLSRALHLFKLCITQPSVLQKKVSLRSPRRSGSIIELKRIYAGHLIHMATKPCDCKDETLLGDTLEEHFSSSKKNIFDDDEEDDQLEHYLRPLVEQPAAVKYDPAGLPIPTGSALSLPPVQVETDMCFDESRMEIPWLSITLPPPGSLIIKGKEGFCLRKPICDCWRMNPEETECHESPPPEAVTFGKVCKCRDDDDGKGEGPIKSSPPPPNSVVPSMESEAPKDSEQPADEPPGPAVPPVTEAPSEDHPPPADQDDPSEKLISAVEINEPDQGTKDRENESRGMEDQGMQDRGVEDRGIEEVPSNCICVDHVSKDMKDCSDIRPLEFVYDNVHHAYIEPYMDAWYYDFPDEMDTPCGPGTEIPWNELLIPRNVKLKVKPRKRVDPNMAMVPCGKNELEKYAGQPPEAFEIKLSFAEFVENTASDGKKSQGVTPKSSNTSKKSKQICACFESVSKKKKKHHRHRSSKRSKDRATHKHSPHHKKIPHGIVSQRSSKTKRGSHHKTKGSKGNYKAEIISALDTCEAEMAPIRNALYDLKAKIQNITASAIDVDYDRCRSVTDGVGCGAPMPSMMPTPPPMGLLPGMGSNSMGYNVPTMDSIPTFTGMGPPPHCGIGQIASLLGPPPMGAPLPSPYGPPPFLAPKETSSTNACKCRRKKSDKNMREGGSRKHRRHHERH